jgi:pimeloyl-ACP methyl ester carboxylesterase
VAPLACAQVWAKEIPGATLTTFAASGHLPHVEEPNAVADTVIGFCATRSVTA